MAKTSILFLIFVLNIKIESLFAFKIPHYINFNPNNNENSVKKDEFDPLVLNLTQCAHLTKAGIVEVENYLKRQPQKNPEGKCFIACMFKKANILRYRKISSQDVVATYSLTNADDSTVMIHLKSALHECMKDLDSGADLCGTASVFSECMDSKLGPVVEAEAKAMGFPDWDWADEVNKNEEHILNRVKARL